MALHLPKKFFSTVLPVPKDMIILNLLKSSTLLHQSTDMVTKNLSNMPANPAQYTLMNYHQGIKEKENEI